MSTKTPPPEQDHEAILLGALLTGRTTTADVPLTADQFAQPKHQALYEAIQTVHAQLGKVTQANVLDAIRDRPDAAKVIRMLDAGHTLARYGEIAEQQFGLVEWHVEPIARAARVRELRADATRYLQQVEAVEQGRVGLDDIQPPSQAGPALALVHTIPTTEPRRRPQLGDDAYYGLAGEIALLLDPYTEADPAAVLVTFLALAGCYLGAGPHMVAGDSRHTARIWPLIIGDTADGAKGTSYAAVRRVITATDRTFSARNCQSGLSSAEGLIELVRDPVGDDPDAPDFDEGIPDKRLAMLEEEFAAVLGRMRRDGNVLSQILRLAWDGGTLRTAVRKVNKLVASEPHIAVVGHITPGELRTKMADSDVAGGLFNRFLPCWSQRSKLLPDGGGAPDELVTELAGKLRQAAGTARAQQAMGRTDAGRDLWHDLYPTLVSCDEPFGPLAQLTARAKAQVLRLSVAYALLDGSRWVDAPHIHAANAVWQYCLDTVRYVWSGTSSDPDLDRIAEYVDQHPGCTRTNIYDDVFRRHMGKSRFDQLLAALVKLPDYEEVKVPTGGRPATAYRRRAQGRRTA